MKHDVLQYNMWIKRQDALSVGDFLTQVAKGRQTNKYGLYDVSQKWTASIYLPVFMNLLTSTNLLEFHYSACYC